MAGCSPSNRWRPRIPDRPGATAVLPVGWEGPPGSAATRPHFIAVSGDAMGCEKARLTCQTGHCAAPFCLTASLRPRLVQPPAGPDADGHGEGGVAEKAMVSRPGRLVSEISHRSHVCLMACPVAQEQRALSAGSSRVVTSPLRRPSVQLVEKLAPFTVMSVRSNAQSDFHVAQTSPG